MIDVYNAHGLSALVVSVNSRAAQPGARDETEVAAQWSAGRPLLAECRAQVRGVDRLREDAPFWLSWFGDKADLLNVHFLDDGGGPDAVELVGRMFGTVS